MNILYNIGISISPAFIWVGSLLSRKLKLFYKGRKGLIKNIQQTFSSEKEGNVIWFHCSSVGEFEQARPVIEWYRSNKPEWKILLTFFSPSGYELRKNYSEADWVFYLPIDTPSNARRFIAAVAPKVVVFTKYDLWSNFIKEAKRSGAELYLISAIFRRYQSFFKWYGGFFRNMLRNFKLIFVQDTESRELLATIGFKDNVLVGGDTRFDRVAHIAATVKEFPVIEEFVKGAGFVLIVGSSWQPDDQIIAGVVKNFSRVRVIVAPHEIHKERIGKVEQIYSGYGVLKYSQFAEGCNNGNGVSANAAVSSEDGNAVTSDTASRFSAARVMIIDSIGILSSLYKYADLTYIGGGFGVGIHNILEAAVFGSPLVFGPNYKKFKEAIDLIALKGAACVNNASDFYQVLDKCVQSKQLRSEKGEICRKYVQDHTGATQRIIDGMLLR